ncbi:hypothetical protein OU798_08220 [Prolixibacteraceae bacterium Z1-6]|uniref:Anti-sigma factor n=1 Tax=Draconibacterium aestuarii TaxID=2998507 RepID=A0A9X3F4P2_9BACT|nr:hypothetical protein [Prolixibacteraceae bacterium Z1-6]
MQTDPLEKFVRANRDEFDFREPSPGVWDKISIESEKPKVLPIRNYFLRVAAVVAVMAVSSVLVWQSGMLSTNNLADNTKDPEMMELLEAEAFYSHQVDQKLKELQKCYYTFPDLKGEVETDLTELEEMYKVLKSDLKDNISNKSVIEAMIENNRFRLKLCNNVLEQINC